MEHKRHFTMRFIASLSLAFLAFSLCASRVDAYGNAYFTEWKIEESCLGSKAVRIPPTMNDKYGDLQAIVKSRVDASYAKIIVDDQVSKENPTLSELLNFPLRWHSTNLEVFQYSISKNEMYPENDKVAQAVLKDLSSFPIDWLEQREGGTQVKLILEMGAGTKALFKPKRMEREDVVHPNHFYFDELERHNAEIAAYHLDKVLGFRRAIPHAGRVVNIMDEIFPFADDEFLKTFYESPAGNKCFTGKCEIYCDTSHPVCGSPNVIEGSFAAFLPVHENATRDAFKHPWRRSYSKRRTAYWERDPNYCDIIRNSAPYNTGRRLLDIMDMAVLDFLMGNMDRHHYEMFRVLGSDSFTIHLDHGRGFGRPYIDDFSILAPLTQCCLIRASTLRTLLRYHNGSTKLSDALRKSMENDLLAPLLWEPHLEALDRRNVLILEAIRTCLKNSK